MKTNSKNRLLSLDVFRGFTIAGMILVNNPGSWDHLLPALHHATWHGCTFADLIFPFFLWVVGAAIPLSFANRMDHGASRSQILRHVFGRAFILFAIGLFLNGFPFGLVPGHTFSWDTIRIPGVLQRIAICFLIGSLIFLYSNIFWQIVSTVFLLTISWLLLKFISLPDFGAGILEPNGNLAWFIDSHLLRGHTYAKALIPGFDPEGIFSTLTAVATALTGVLTGHSLRSKKTQLAKTAWMLITGILCICFGSLLNNWLPINKSLWTSSYVIFTTGMALTIFSCCYWLIDIRKYQKWFKPLEIYGLNALTIFVTSGIIGRLTLFIRINEPAGLVSFKTYYYHFITQLIPNLMLASFLHAILFMIIMYFIAYELYRAKITIKA